MYWDLKLMCSVNLVKVTENTWESEDGIITVTKNGDKMSITTSKVTDQSLYWGTDCVSKEHHWSCEISFGGDDQWMMWIFPVGSNLRMYWENSY